MAASERGERGLKNLEKRKPTLDKYELRAVTEAFLARLDRQMSSAGCNDLCSDEFSRPVIEKFGSDFALFRQWKEQMGF